MKKATSYFDDEIYSKMEEMAKQDKRSLNQILNMVVERGLNFDAQPSAKVEIDETYLKMPEVEFEKVKQFAISDDRPTSQMALMFLQKGIKEKERLREKYLKSLEKKQ